MCKLLHVHWGCLGTMDGTERFNCFKLFTNRMEFKGPNYEAVMTPWCVTIFRTCLFRLKKKMDDGFVTIISRMKSISGMRLSLNKASSRPGKLFFTVSI